MIILDKSFENACKLFRIPLISLIININALIDRETWIRRFSSFVVVEWLWRINIFESIDIASRPPMTWSAVFESFDVCSAIEF